MSTGLGKGIGIPVKLLHESEGHTVTVRVSTASGVHPASSTRPRRSRDARFPGSRPKSLQRRKT